MEKTKEALERVKEEVEKDYSFKPKINSSKKAYGAGFPLNQEEEFLER
jgi:hypothetical protein